MLDYNFFVLKAFDSQTSIRAIVWAWSSFNTDRLLRIGMFGAIQERCTLWIHCPAFRIRYCAVKIRWPWFKIQRSTIHIQWSAIPIQWSTFHILRSTIHIQCSTFHILQSTIHIQQSRLPEPVENWQGAENHECWTILFLFSGKKNFLLVMFSSNCVLTPILVFVPYEAWLEPWTWSTLVSSHVKDFFFKKSMEIWTWGVKISKLARVRILPQFNVRSIRFLITGWY